VLKPFDLIVNQVNLINDLLEGGVKIVKLDLGDKVLVDLNCCTVGKGVDVVRKGFLIDSVGDFFVLKGVFTEKGAD